jgi:hypothetical protein
LTNAQEELAAPAPTLHRQRHDGFTRVKDQSHVLKPVFQQHYDDGDVAQPPHRDHGWLSNR